MLQFAHSLSQKGNGLPPLIGRPTAANVNLAGKFRENPGTPDENRTWGPFPLTQTIMTRPQGHPWGSSTVGGQRNSTQGEREGRSARSGTAAPAKCSAGLGLGDN